MEWISINTGFADMRRYHLLMDDGLQLILKYSPLQQSVRVSFRNNHQTFFMESVGGGKVVFSTVYGVEIGRFSYNSRNQTGRVQVEQASLQFTIANKSRPSVVFFEQNKKQALLTCHLPNDLKQEAQGDNLQLACLCLSLCWSLTGAEATVSTVRKRG